jgi:hypothetical protein
MGKRGGSRLGAGRKSLTKVDRLLIGARVSAASDAASEASALKRHEERLPYEDIEGSRLALESARDRSKLSPGLKEELNWITETLDGHRLISFKRPQSQMGAIISRIATEESKRLGITITPRQVRRWWGEYRKWLEEQRHAV